MGYSWLSQYRKEHEFKEFIEIANYLENGLMQRMVAEDEEEQEEMEGKEGGSTDESNKFMMTEEAVKIMVTMVAADMMTKVEKIKEKLGEIELTQEAAKQMADIGFKDIERSFLTEHAYIREKFGQMEDNIRGVKHLVIESSNKRKNSEMDEDKVETDGSDGEDEEPKTGAQCNDMSRVQKDDIKKWLEDNPDRKADAMMPFDKALMNDKGK
eukprot:15707212-Heterocapsa_arctica.AAC.1